MALSTINIENILFVFALERETHTLFSQFNCVFSGVGKVNACYELMRGLQDWRKKKGSCPELVLNLGSAGSSSFKAGELVNCTQFYQRDMDVTALGLPSYATPFEESDAPLSKGMRFETYPEGICGSGDQFVTAAVKGPWNVIDMEAFALAKVCLKEDIPFACLKYITDGADESAAQDWDQMVERSATALHEAVRQIFSL